MTEAYTYSVGELNRLIKELVEGSGAVAHVQVRGEVSNFKRYPSGHCYFSLKDGTGVLKCVMFRRQALRLTAEPANGDTVVAVGRIAVYERDGAYQLYTDLLVPEGTGDLMQAYEKLKNKLAAEGLFDEARKKPLPAHPHRVGIITSPAGAAVRDVIIEARRKDPGVRLFLYPVQVQGKGAAAEISHAIEFMNQKQLADVLIVGRGGGSMEDLWAFNEEIVVRSIAASRIPVISSVGHETDFTLADFAADKRAATPTQAAILAVPDTATLLEKIEQNRQRLENALLNQLKHSVAVYDRLVGSPLLRHPSRLLERSEERLDKAWMRLRQTLPLRIASREYRLRQAVRTLGHPEKMLAEPEQRWQSADKNLRKATAFWLERERRQQKVTDNLMRAAEETLRQKRTDLSVLAARLQAVSPLGVLARGYSVTTGESGHLIKSTSQTHWGEEIRTRLCDGIIYSVIQQIERQEEHGNEKIGKKP